MYTISSIFRSIVRINVSTKRSIIMVPATGNNGFGTVCECGRTLVPRPAIGIINFILPVFLFISYLRMEQHARHVLFFRVKYTVLFFECPSKQAKNYVEANKA